MSTSNAKTSRKRIKKSSRSQVYVIPQRRLPSLQHIPFTDYGLNPTAVSTTVSPNSILTSIQSVLQTYPQHATPVYIQGGTSYRLRQTIVIRHIEVRIQVVGAQATALLSADLYNSVRMALYFSGPNFQDSSQAYLTTVMNHPNILDIDEVVLDEVFSLPSQAFDSSSGYNVPQVINKVYKIPINRKLNFYSTTSAGTGAWDTEKYDLLVDAVSDSSVTPHPTLSYQIRLFFEFCK